MGKQNRKNAERRAFYTYLSSVCCLLLVHHICNMFEETGFRFKIEVRKGKLLFLLNTRRYFSHETCHHTDQGILSFQRSFWL